MPPRPETRSMIASTVACGECPGMRAGVAQRDVDVLVAVDVGHARAARLGQEDRRAARPLRPSTASGRRAAARRARARPAGPSDGCVAANASRSRSSSAGGACGRGRRRSGRQRPCREPSSRRRRAFARRAARAQPGRGARHAVGERDGGRVAEGLARARDRVGARAGEVAGRGGVDLGLAAGGECGQRGEARRPAAVGTVGRRPAAAAARSARRTREVVTPTPSLSVKTPPARRRRLRRGDDPVDQVVDVHGREDPAPARGQDEAAALELLQRQQRPRARAAGRRRRPGG